jgi:citrate lyase subunit beta/citryl-CoA lyase
MKKPIAFAGNSGPKVRSDCEITLELKTDKGIIIDLVSKVKTLYGESIKNLIYEILEFFEIRNASVSINDSGVSI